MWYNLESFSPRTRWGKGAGVRGSAIVAVLLAVPAGAAEPARVAGLVRQLGAADYAEREAAAKALTGVGESALPALRVALAADDAEVARRAADLVAGITRAAEARRLLAPTLVTLAAPDDTPLTLRDVTAAWAKASGVEFALAPESLGRTPVTSRAAGPLPLWAAVDLVAAELDLDLSARATPNAPADRVALTLTPNRVAKRPPRFTEHALAVEAVPPADGVTLPADSLSVVLQTHAEPRLGLQRLDAVVVTKATDARGQELRTLPAVLAAPPVTPTYRGRGMRNVDFEVRIVPATPAATNFAPTPAQALVRFARPDAAPGRLAVLEGILRATVRGPKEEIARVTGLDKKPLAGASERGVSLSVNTVPNAGDGTAILVVTVTSQPGELAFGDRPRAAGDAVNVRGLGLPGVSAANSAAAGLAVADANGVAFEVSVTTTSLRPMPDGRLAEQLFLRLVPTEQVRGAPATLTLTGARTRPLDIPFVLRDVPLHPGTAQPTPTPAPP